MRQRQIGVGRGKAKLRRSKLLGQLLIEQRIKWGRDSHGGGHHRVEESMLLHSGLLPLPLLVSRRVSKPHNQLLAHAFQLEDAVQAVDGVLGGGAARELDESVALALAGAGVADDRQLVDLSVGSEHLPQLFLRRGARKHADEQLGLLLLHFALGVLDLDGVRAAGENLARVQGRQRHVSVFFPHECDKPTRLGRLRGLVPEHQHLEDFAVLPEEGFEVILAVGLWDLTDKELHRVYSPVHVFLPLFLSFSLSLPLFFLRHLKHHLISI